MTPSSSSKYCAVWMLLLLLGILAATQGQTPPSQAPRVAVDGSVQPAPGHKLRIELDGSRGSGEVQPDGTFHFQASGQPGDIVEATIWDGSTQLQKSTQTLGTAIPWGILLPAGSPAATDSTLPRAVLLSLLLSVMAGVVDLWFRSKAELASCFAKPSWLYIALTATSNTISAAGASLLLKNSIPGGPWLTPLYYAVFGVFAFQAVVSNMNVTIFQKGVLPFDDWIAKAREPAVNAVLANQTQREKNRTVELAKELTRLPDSQLTTFVIDALGKDGAALIDAATAYGKQYGADPKLYVALGFASAARQKVEAVVKHAW